MIWKAHAFSDVFTHRCEPLLLEPRRYDLPPPQRLGQFSLEFRNLPKGVRISLDPPHLIRRTLLDRGYRIDGLMGFAGAIVLQTDDAEWRVNCLHGEVLGLPTVIPTLAAKRRLQAVQAMWTAAYPGQPHPHWFKGHPTGCTRVLILAELGATILSPPTTASSLDSGTFLGAMDRVWPAMAAWLRALDCDPSSGAMSGRRRLLEFGLLRQPPPIIA
jgi:hypothetical protein